MAPSTRTAIVRALAVVISTERGSGEEGAMVAIRLMVLSLLIVVVGAACSDEPEGAEVTIFPGTTIAPATTTAVPATTAAPATTATTMAPTTTATTAAPAAPVTTSPPPTTAPTAAPLADGPYSALVFFVNLGDGVFSIDPLQWVWTGPADTEGNWTNDDPTHLLLPFSTSVMVTACPEDMSGSLPPMIYCGPDEQVSHSITKLAQWVHGGAVVGQNDRFMSEIPGHNGQLWDVIVANGEISEVHGFWVP